MSRFDNELAQVAEETFQSMAFMFPISEEEASGGEDAAVVARVSFEGPFRGQITMRLSSSISEPLASNMLGLDDDAPPTPEQQNDAVREVLNVICGNILPIIGTPQDVFNVSAPVIVRGPGGLVQPAADSPEQPQAQPAGEARLLLDCGTVELTLLLDNFAGAAA